MSEEVSYYRQPEEFRTVPPLARQLYFQPVDYFQLPKRGVTVVCNIVWSIENYVQLPKDAIKALIESEKVDRVLEAYKNFKSKESAVLKESVSDNPRAIENYPFALEASFEQACKDVFEPIITSHGQSSEKTGQTQKNSGLLRKISNLF
jgi:hypothetical protein